MKGSICQWNDKKGYGFINPDDGSDKLFFHISSVKTGARRPKVGDNVLFEATRDSQQRLNANDVVIEDIANASHSSPKESSTPNEPLKKNALDYISILVLVGVITVAGLEFYRSNTLETIWHYSLPAFIALVVFNRTKKPKDKTFNCSRCNAVTNHNALTIETWNNGSKELYCETCHLQSLDEISQKKSTSIHSKFTGWLGALTVMAVVPMFTGVGYYQWLA